MTQYIRLTAAFAVVLFSVSAYADKPMFGDTFTFGIGGMEQNAKASFQSTREGRPPIELNMNDLGMDPKTTTVWAGFTWQFADKWGFGASYSGFSSKGDVRTSESGNFGDIDWNINADLTSELDLDLYIIDFHWDFIKTERSHFGAGLGLHIADLSTGISATVSADINGNPIPTQDLGSETAAVTAPLPNISIRGGHRFGESVYVGATLGYFSLDTGDIDGELTSFRAQVEWRPGASNFGLGAGYQYVDFKITDNGGSDRVKKFNFGPKEDVPVTTILYPIDFLPAT